MHIETKFLRLCRAVEIGDDLDGWRVCWLGGWDKCRVLFVVMVKRLPIELQRHAQELAADAAEWMPWNYRQTLEPAGVR